MNLRFFLDMAPPTPPCFQDRMSWATFLHQSQSDGKRQSARPFDEARVYRPAFNFCRECASAHQSAMQATGKCKPTMFRGIAVVVIEQARA